MYRFRIYLTKEKNNLDLCLDTLIKENYEYEILFCADLIYENLIKEALLSDLSIVYIDEKTKERKIDHIDEFNSVLGAMQNAEIFLDKWYNLGIQIDKIKS